MANPWTLASFVDPFTVYSSAESWRRRHRRPFLYCRDYSAIVAVHVPSRFDGATAAVGRRGDDSLPELPKSIRRRTNDRAALGRRLAVSRKVLSNCIKLFLQFI